MNPYVLVAAGHVTLGAVAPSIMGWINLGIGIYSAWRLYHWLNTPPVIY